MYRFAPLCLIAYVACVAAAPQLARGDLGRVGKDAKLHQFTEDDINQVLSNEKSMKILTNCFLLYPAKCKSPIGQLLIGQVNNLGSRKSCQGCTEEERTARNALIYKFVQGFSAQYPAMWKEVVGKAGVILAQLRT